MTNEELKAEIARVQEENRILQDTIQLALKLAHATIEQRDMENKRLLAGDEWRASVIAEYRGIMERAGLMKLPESPDLQKVAA